MLLLFQVGYLNYHLFVKEVFIRFPVRIFREHLSICVCVCLFSFFCFEGRMWDLIVLVHDHCLLFNFIGYIQRYT